jgi:hypothetical protein
MVNGQPYVHKNGEVLLKEIGVLGIVRLMRECSVGKIGVYTPYNVVDILHRRKIPIRFETIEGVDYVIFSGKEDHKQKLIEGYPQCTKDLEKFMSEIFPAMSPEVYQYDEALARVTRYCVTLFNVNIAKKQVVFGGIEQLDGLMGGNTKLFQRGVITAGLEKMKAFILGPDGEDELVTRMNGGNTRPLDEWYRFIYRRFSSMPESGKFIRIFDNLMAKDDEAMKKVAIRSANTVVTTFDYLDTHHQVRGKDEQPGSAITRQMHTIPCAPGSFSTAEKWNDVLSAVSKLEPKEKSRYLVAGCKPGHFIPLVRHYLEHISEVTKSSMVENIEVPSSQKTNITFVDVEACPEQNDPSMHWVQRDVFHHTPNKNTVLISDAWSKQCKTVQGQYNFCRNMALYLSGYAIRPNGGVEKGAPFKHFAVKFVFGMAKGEARKKLKNDWIPPAFMLIFTRAVKNKWWITQIGRPHNGEFVLSDFQINSRSFVPESEKSLAKRLCGYIVVNNLKRLMAVWKPYPYPGFTMPREMFPVARKEELDIDDSLMEEIDSVFNLVKSVPLKVNVDVDNPVRAEAQRKKNVPPPKQVPVQNVLPSVYKAKPSAPANLVIKKEPPEYDNDDEQALANWNDEADQALIDDLDALTN